MLGGVLGHYNQGDVTFKGVLLFSVYGTMFGYISYNAPSPSWVNPLFLHN